MSVYRSEFFKGMDRLVPVPFEHWGGKSDVTPSEAIAAYRRYCDAIVSVAAVYGCRMRNGVAERGCVRNTCGTVGERGSVGEGQYRCGDDGGSECGRTFDEVGKCFGTCSGVSELGGVDALGFCYGGKVCAHNFGEHFVGQSGTGGYDSAGVYSQGDDGGTSVGICEDGRGFSESLGKSNVEVLSGVSAAGVEVSSVKVGVPGAFGRERVQVGGVNRDRNRQRRVEKKEKKIRRQERGVDSRDWRSKVPLELNDSWVARKNAENELATLKAKKDLEFQKSRDVEAETKRRRVAVMKNTERDRVAVEKAFATLKVTGNVPGFCATVVDSETPGLSSTSGSGLSISPDSSISQSEIRAMIKENEDLKSEVRKLKRTAKLEKANDYNEVAITNDGEEPSPSLQEDMDERSKRYQLEYAYEPGWVNGKDVLLIKTANHYGECDIY